MRKSNWIVWYLLLAVVPATAMPLLFSPSCAAQVTSAPAAKLQLPGDVPELPGLAEPVADVLDMDLEQLSRADVLVPALDTVVSTVSRQESTVGRSPAAVFVITPEMIRRSGARNVPDLLRMVPGVEVARINANVWAITIRGFNSRLANKLLVQIDGRSVYVLPFSGVFWEVQNLVLEDIERIEVIRGPGATVWGANAVNGVINIITKQAKDTQGLLIVGGTGTEERGFSTVRYGGTNGRDFYWRMYGMQFERDGGYHPDLEFDDWRLGQGGFRADWTPTGCDTITFQGDYYDGRMGGTRSDFEVAPVFSTSLEVFDTNFRGQNYLSRWTHIIDEDSDWSLQAYYDNREKTDPLIDDGQQTFDVDFQYRFPWRERHNVIAGASYRHTRDRVAFDTPATAFDPQRRFTDLYSYFIQDEVTLVENRWYLTVGSKFEHNDFSGFEFQPTIRLLHLPSERESLWAAVSRAVRTPNRAEHDHMLTFPIDSGPPFPTFFQLLGDDGVEAEELLAFEMGYRAAPTDDLSYDLAAFYNHYDDLVGTVFGVPFFDLGLGGLVLPLTFANTTSADTYGFELTSTWQVNPKWELFGSYTLLYMDVHAGEFDFTEGSSPHNQVYFRSSWTPRCDWELDTILRYVDNLPAQGVSSYMVMDVRMAWKPRRNLEWAVVGRNLLDSKHREFGDALALTTGTEVQHEVYTVLTWTY